MLHVTPDWLSKPLTSEQVDLLLRQRGIIASAEDLLVLGDLVTVIREQARSLLRALKESPAAGEPGSP